MTAIPTHVAALMESGDGLVRRCDLRSAGISARREGRLLARGVWSEPLPGVVAASARSLDARQRLRAALLYAGHSDAYLSHVTVLEALDVLAPGARVHVSVPHGRKVKPFGFVVVHQTRWPGEATDRAGLRWSVPERALSDSSAMLGPVELREAVLRLVQRPGIDIEGLRKVVRLGAPAGRRELLLALDEVERGSRSPLEGITYRAIERAGLALPEFNGRIETPRGPRFVDLLWRRLMLGVEIDGEAYHREASRWRADLARQNDLVAQGFVLLRFPGARVVYDVDEVVAEIGRALRARAQDHSRGGTGVIDSRFTA